LTNVRGTLFFSANDGVHGNQLWQSDGTAAGTSLVANIGPPGAGSYPTYLTNINGRLFFSADDGTHGREPWTLEADFNPTANIASQGIVDAAFMGTTGLPGALAGSSTVGGWAAYPDHSSVAAPAFRNPSGFDPVGLAYTGQGASSASYPESSIPHGLRGPHHPNQAEILDALLLSTDPTGPS
jgi:ELWxxDGT repeat protein